MDLHIIPGVKAKEVAEAHRRDLLIQDEHTCNCMTYWIDEKRGNVFCLIEAPTANDVVEMHNKAHGLIPHRIIEVSPSLVESFLGRISDPEDATTSAEGLKIFSDPSFRVLLAVKTEDPVLLQHRIGKEKAGKLLQHVNQLIKKEITLQDGIEAEHAGTGFIASFTSAAKAVACALAVQNKIIRHDITVSTGVNAGEPVTNSGQFFGETIQLAEQIGSLAGKKQIAISTSVKELISKDNLGNKPRDIVILSKNDETLLHLLFNKLEERWQDENFNVSDYCHIMAMSSSQLYRKTIEITGFSPNKLLKEFRLEKAKELMKKGQYNISQITFDCGFTSPSYFTKCFKKKYGLLPMAYLDLL